MYAPSTLSTRRAFLSSNAAAGLAFSGLALATGCSATRSPSPRGSHTPLLGFLALTSLLDYAPYLDAFHNGLGDLGYVEGENINTIARFAGGDVKQLQELASEFVRLDVDIIVAAATQANQAALNATHTIPIVMTNSGDPVGAGLVKSLAQPGGNLTGLTSLNRELAGKRLELLKTTVPRLSRVGVLWNEASLNDFQETQTSAQWLGLALVSLRVEHASEIPDALDTALLPGRRVRAHYQPAHAVGGDFYDVVPLPDGRLGLVIGDVSGEGIPAALTMATTRTMLRSVASTTTAPGEVLARTNELLCQDVPQGMFATCLYAVLDPRSGQVRFANAGHGAPFQRHAVDGSVTELRARGMPLGLIPSMTYPESEAVLAPGDLVLAYSDGLTEAHSPRREMFGVTRVAELVNNAGRTGTQLVNRIVGALEQFTGPNWEQEDDLTVVVLERNPDGAWRTLDQFDVASQPGNERAAMVQVADAVARLGLPVASIERLKTAVSEAVMNAMDHGNRYQADVHVHTCGAV